MNYYNEIDPHAAQWLRNLIDAGHIAPGWVDTRSIEDVTPDDLRQFTQCHFFAGLGGWALALDLAGWPRDRPVWTGSCPCQPFSAAGKGDGFDDERHLWPAWQHLITERRPPVIFGEQVASKAAAAWIDLVHADMEGLDYAFGCIPFPAAGIGAPHIRDRNYWMADTNGGYSSAEREQRGWEYGQFPQNNGGVRDRRASPTNGQWRDADWLACRDGKWRPVEPGTFPLLDGLPASLERLGTLEMAGWEEVIRYGDANKTHPDQVLRMVQETFRTGSSRKEQQPGMFQQLHAEEVLFGYLFHVEAACDQSAVTSCRTKKSSEAQRRIVRSLRKKYGNGGSPCECRPSGQSNREPANPLFELSFVLARYAQAYWEECRKAHAASGRVGMLRAYGNAIVPAQAAEFIGAYLDTY